ncbi:hypothetical protein JEQ12_003724 [Ovis aries]|uniref:Uncharacterized protein n=1 Tax=Ovis aries TaxID=9940 RepID=A0A836CYG7_SHEEP|nr:hypothetical protein JEQ12_003724 [Ovis aries]
MGAAAQRQRPIQQRFSPHGLQSMPQMMETQHVSVNDAAAEERRKAFLLSLAAQGELETRSPGEGTEAQEQKSLNRSRIESMFPALECGFLTTEPPEKLPSEVSFQAAAKVL